MSHSTEATPRHARDLAWDLITGNLEEDQAEAFLTDIETDPESVEALLETSEELLQLRALGDAAFRAAWTEPDTDGLDVDAMLQLEHDPDALLQAAIADEQARTTAWARFQRFIRQPGTRMTIGVLAAATALFVMLQPAAPVPDYAGAWRTGASTVRATPGEPGRYLVGNVADLVLRPDQTVALADPAIRVFVGRNGGALEPVVADTETSPTKSVRVLIEVTPELGVGTHRVVVLIGRNLERADPETDADDWARFETTMLVVDRL